MKTNLLTPQNKSKVLSVAVIALTIATIAGGTLAFFTDEKTAHNVVTTAGIEIEIQEWADEDKETPFPTDGIEDVMPGTDVIKIVEIYNKEEKAWVRAKVNVSIELENENIEPDTDLVKLNFNEEYWEKDGEYWYYKTPVEKEATTEPLFTTVTFDKNMGNAYQNSTVHVDVAAYAVQWANNDATTATEVNGWPAE